MFDREKAFIEEVLGPTVERFASLKVVLEHITTREAVQYVEVTGPKVAATITAHHLLMNRNALFMGGIRPHHYCLPVLKREEHREALVEAATSGNPKFFLGTDSAPHPRGDKEAACGCAGIYTGARGARALRDRLRGSRRARARWKASRANSAHGSTGCRRTKAPSPSRARTGPCRSG